MKKITMFTGAMLITGMAGLGAYILLNKNTSKKANQLINTMLDETTTMMKKCS